MKKVFLSAVMGAAIMCSCSTTNTSVNLAGEWNIVTVEGEEVASEETPFIGFDIKDGRMYGNAGCNSIMANVTVDSVKNTIALSNVGATRMMCPDMKLEGKVLSALEKVAGYQVSEVGVELTDAEGKVVFGLEKKQAPAYTVADLQGEWLISTVESDTVEVVENTPFIAFDINEKRVYGTGGCNIFNAEFTQDDTNATSLRFGQMGATMKAGPGMEQEGKILPAFEKVRSFDINTDGTVSLLDENNAVVIVLTKNTGKSLAE